jgi:hexulose-6-phosphate isomerase
MVEEETTILEKFRLLRELGFDGVELDSPNDFDEEEVLEATEKTGLEIPGVIDSIHWTKPLSDPDPAVRAEGLEGLRTALRDAKTYGADTALLVPAVVNKQISYDEAYVRSQEEIRKVLPLAEELQVKIAVENVWNHFLLSPIEMARYLDEFESPWIGAYFDVGNIVNYGWPEQWIRILGKRILKLDIKEFSRKKRDEEGLWAGFAVKIGEGECDWPAVMSALVEIDYRGWGSAEVPGGGAERLREISRRMDEVLGTV